MYRPKGKYPENVSGRKKIWGDKKGLQKYSLIKSDETIKGSRKEPMGRAKKPNLSLGTGPGFQPTGRGTPVTRKGVFLLFSTRD